MSDTTDDMEAAAAEYEYILDRRQEQVEKKQWQTKDGEVIYIRDMESSHLTNTINLLRRSAVKRRERMLSDAHQTLSLVRGEQATWDIENDISQLEEATTDELCEEFYPHFENLMNEATKRKLEVSREKAN